MTSAVSGRDAAREHRRQAREREHDDGGGERREGVERGQHADSGLLTGGAGGSRARPAGDRTTAR
ncbi:hypothetical protein [Brachybacterium sp. GPGPB12]|uniref:hypothetical protein n=1 Tax=Brachybacterium sp. GPGPB12 TaxID=3023517 RepID=UPI003134514A